MKHLLLILSIVLTFLSSGLKAQVASDFITDQINTFYDLHNSSIEFDKQLLYIRNTESARKSIDEYSLQIEKSIGILSKYKKTKDENINKVADNLSNLLKDMLGNNYQLLGKLIKEDYPTENLKKDCLDLVNKNSFVSGFIRDIALGVCMSLVKEKPKGAKENEQFLKLTKKQKDSINDLLITKFGETIKQGKEVKSKTPFEYSCRLIYEFINMKWIFEKK
jgi:hypothetical protein